MRRHRYLRSNRPDGRSAKLTFCSIVGAGPLVPSSLFSVVSVSTDIRIPIRPIGTGNSSGLLLEFKSRSAAAQRTIVVTYLLLIPIQRPGMLQIWRLE